MIKVGIIGFGVMGKNHLNSLNKIDDVTVVGICDLELNEFILNGNEIALSLDDLIDKQPDYCVVSVPTRNHFEIVRVLGNNSINTLVEKPITENLKQAQEIIEIFDRKSLVGGVGHVERFNASIIKAVELIEKGIIGEIYQISTRRLNSFPSRTSDVGVIKDLATHDIDLVNLIGKSNYEDITSYTKKVRNNQFEDLLAVSAILSNKIIVNHIVNWVSPFKERIIEITGSEGVLKCDTLNIDLFHFQKISTHNSWENISYFKGAQEGQMIKYALNKDEPLRTMHSEFIKAIRGERNKTVTFEEGLKALIVADQMLQKSEN
jgi:predicted dehydrogenase